MSEYHHVAMIIDTWKRPFYTEEEMKAGFQCYEQGLKHFWIDGKEVTEAEMQEAYPNLMAPAD